MGKANEQIILRAIEESDMECMIDLLTNDIIKKTYMVPDFASREEAERLARRFVDLSHDADHMVVGIELNGRLIGFINDVEKSPDTMELGYALHPQFHNRGYMTAALGAVIDALFQCGYLSVYAGAFEENKASLRVMEKCGMRRDPKREYIRYRGEDHACVYYVAANPHEEFWPPVESYGGLMG